MQRCRELRQTNEHIKRSADWVESLDARRICPRPRAESADWILHETPMCNEVRTGPFALYVFLNAYSSCQDCSAPLPCLVTDSCRCPRDRCALPKTPIASVKDIPLQTAVDAMRWNSVIHPHARIAFNTSPTEYPKGHVVQVPATIDNHLTNEACYKLSAAPVPFSADHVLIEALRTQNVSVAEADYVMLPYYQGKLFELCNCSS